MIYMQLLNNSVPPTLHTQSGDGSVPPHKKKDQRLTTLPPFFIKVVDPPPIFHESG